MQNYEKNQGTWLSKDLWFPLEKTECSKLNELLLKKKFDQICFNWPIEHTDVSQDFLTYIAMKILPRIVQ